MSNKNLIGSAFIIDFNDIYFNGFAFYINLLHDGNCKCFNEK